MNGACIRSLARVRVKNKVESRLGLRFGLVRVTGEREYLMQTHQMQADTPDAFYP